MNCDLEGCTHQFEVKIYPRQYIYPKYCPEHRNEYRRIRHLELINRPDLIELMKQEGENFELEHLPDREVEHIDEEMIDDVA
jgi:hypothetical protein